jgi:hypothetical protein
MEGITMLVTLTPDFIANRLICPPGQRRVEYVDQGGLGLYVEVRSTNPGAGTYYLRYKNVNNKTCHQKIGTTAAVSLVEARKEAKRIKAEVTLGADPRAEAKAKKAVITYDDFFQNHYLPYVKPRKRSWDRDEELYRLRIKSVFGNKRLNQITRQQIQSFHTALSDEGLAAATANHHIKLIRYTLNLAIGWGMLEANPAAKIPLLPELNHVENVVDDVELARLLHVLRTDRNKTVCRIAMLLLATGSLSPAEAHPTSRTPRMLTDDIEREHPNELRRPHPRRSAGPAGVLRAELPAGCGDLRRLGTSHRASPQAATIPTCRPASRALTLLAHVLSLSSPNIGDEDGTAGPGSCSTTMDCRVVQVLTRSLPTLDCWG